MTASIFIVSLVAGATLLSLSIVSLLSRRIQFWPPPNKDTWQYSTFWGLFRVMFIGLLALCVLDFNGVGAAGTLRYLLGVPLTVLGFGAASYATFYLGWSNAHGESKGLKTNGWYRWSRNPIYVVSIIGMFGLAITINSLYVYVILTLWALMYLIAPFLEEPWLEKQYGKEFLTYKARVPRFIGHIQK